jgi:5-methylcytosine-specific restriction endonuclease McrA
MLKRDPKAGFRQRSAGFFRTRTVWDFIAGKLKRVEPFSDEEYQQLLAAQANGPVPIMRAHPKSWWFYCNEVYCEDELLTADQVKILVLDRLLQSQKRLQRAVARLSATANQAPGRDPIPDDVKTAVWRRDQGKCIQCGSSDRLEFDHIIPVSMGGSNTVRNIQLLCEHCNRDKGGHLT